MGWKWYEKMFGTETVTPKEVVTKEQEKTVDIVKETSLAAIDHSKVEPHISIYNQKVDINGDYNAKDLALTMYLIHLGEYATLMITALKLRLEQSRLTEEERKIFMRDFTFAYETLLANDAAIKNAFIVKNTVNVTKPVVRPIEAFRQS